METRSRFSRRGQGLTLPVDIPPARVRAHYSGDRSSFDNHDLSPNSHSPTRHIATQTPTEHFSFTFDLSAAIPDCVEEVDKLEGPVGPDKRRRPMLYGKHSFREVRGETSWIPRWLRRSSTGSTPSPSKVQRSVSMSLSSSPEDAKEVGKQLRMISDNYEGCRKGKSQSQTQISSLL